MRMSLCKSPDTEDQLCLNLLVVLKQCWRPDLMIGAIFPLCIPDLFMYIVCDYVFNPHEKEKEIAMPELHAIPSCCGRLAYDAKQLKTTLLLLE